MALNTSTSIVDYLKDKGQGSSYADRKNLAAQYGISNYSGSASQNTQLLNALKNSGSAGSSTNKTSGDTSYSGSANGSSGSGNAGAQVAQNLAAQVASIPVYDSPYQDQIDGLLNKIMNREPFSYDMKADPLYQQYKDQYVHNGNLAMRDTMGNAASLTGGYGNTYATIAGSQANDQYLSKLNDKSMDLYNLALDKYYAEGEDMYRQLSSLTGLEDLAYQKYTDAYNLEYQREQDELAQANWEKEFALTEASKNADLAYKQYLMNRTSSSGKESDADGSGSGGTVKSGYGNQGFSTIGDYYGRLLSGMTNLEKYEALLTARANGEIGSDDTLYQIMDYLGVTLPDEYKKY